MLFARILQDRKGGVAPLLALAIIPIVGAVGAAVDYSRANLVRTSMQNALDSTALMLSKDAQTLTSAQLEQKAASYFNAMFQRPEASNVQVTQQLTTPEQGKFNLKVTGTANVATMFWRVLGQDQINLTATGEVTWGIKKLNLALALDNTGSMSSSSKMTELKTAAHSLLATLKAAEKVPGDIKVSIVPSRSTSMSAPVTSAQTGSTGPIGNPRTAPAASPPIAAARATARRTTESGPPRTTISGTVASWIGTRTTTR